MKVKKAEKLTGLSSCLRHILQKASYARTESKNQWEKGQAVTVEALSRALRTALIDAGVWVGPYE